MTGLDGNTIIVTGSSTGLGRAMAKRFGNEGANVVTNSRKKARAESTAEEIRDANGEAISVEADVTDMEEVRNLVDTAVDKYGRLDVMVNNAGMTVQKPLLEQTEDEWRSVVEANLTGVFFGCQVAGEQMIEQGDGGQILNMSSVYGSVGAQGRAPYNASKAGVDNLTRCAAVEFAEHDIHVNAMAPGYIKTRMAEAPWGESTDEQPDWPYYEYSEEHIENRTPLGRFGTFEEVANCAVFMAKGDHYMTGHTLFNDGGWTAFGWGSRGT